MANKITDKVSTVYSWKTLYPGEVYDYFPIEKSYIPKLPDQLIGLEIEVEGITEDNVGANLSSALVRGVQDHSLKVNGLEYVTCPHKVKYTETLLKHIYTYLDDSAIFTDRTSIHVHVNVRDYTFAQLKSVILSYIAVEKLIYKYVGEKRRKSIFCIPIQETPLLHNLHKILHNKMLTPDISWSKYTGLNLLPILNYGTIEFRHLFGTDSQETILEWISIIQSFFKFAETYELEMILEMITSLNTKSEYRAFLETLFERDADTFLRMFNYEKDLEYGSTFIKYTEPNTKFLNKLIKDYKTTDNLVKGKKPGPIYYDPSKFILSTEDLVSLLSGAPVVAEGTPF